MDDSNFLSLFKDFLGTISEIIWPVVFILALFLLTRVVPTISKKLREKAGSKKKSTFHSELRLLEEALTIAREELGDAGEIDRDDLRALVGADPDAREILETARLDPELGIIKLVGLLDKETRILAGSSGDLEHRRILKAQGPLKSVVEKRYLPKQIVRAIEKFTGLSNRVVGKKIACTYPDVQRLLEMGLLLVHTMRCMHGVSHRVYKADLDLFSDGECTNLIPDLKGVIIEKTGLGGRRIETRIVPTSSPGYYREGRQVTLEWNTGRLCSTAYYIDPDRHEKDIAWGSSAEFSGKHLDEP